MMNKALPLIMILFVVFSASMAYALSCAPAPFNKEIFENAEIVFEGVAEEGRAVTRKEKKALKKALQDHMSDQLSVMKIFEFTVTKGWKGTDDGNTILIVRNTYWGDDFVQGIPYFVLIPKKVGEFNFAPLCGHTMRTKHAKDQGFLKIVEKEEVQQKETYRVALSFTSACCGTDDDTVDAYFKFLKGYQKENNIEIEYTSFGWGEEGEFTIGLKLNELSETEQNDFVLQLKESLKDQKLFDLVENYQMPPYHIAY